MKKTLFSDRRWQAGLGFLSLIALGALLAPWLSAVSPLEMNLPLAFQVPSWQHPFGLDENGADIYSQVLYGARVSLLVALTVVFINLMVGALVGSFSGWAGGALDQVLMRGVDMVSAFPRFLLALAILAMMGTSVYHLILAMCLSGWSSFARLVRAEILHLKQEEYVLGALSYGAGSWRILIRHIWPNLLGPVWVQVAFSLAAVVVGEAGLSFLGLGLPPETPSWGRLLSAGRQYLLEAPHLSLFPGLALLLLVLSFQLCAEALRDYFDPHKAYYS